MAPNVFSILLALMVISSVLVVMTAALVIPTPLKTAGSSRRQSHLLMSSSAASTKKQPGTAKLDTEWENLGFEFRPTNSHVKLVYKDGEWSRPELATVRATRQF